MSQESIDLNSIPVVRALEDRFSSRAFPAPGFTWEDVARRLYETPEKCNALQWMEESGGEPAPVRFHPATGEILVFDCSPETPKGRRSLCYDQAALDSRKEHKPSGSAVGLAHSLGLELLTEEDYIFLQTLGEFDLKTSSWLRTPDEIRALGGAIFGDRRFGRTFIYHNGAESYYGSRGFRCCLRL